MRGDNSKKAKSVDQVRRESEIVFKDLSTRAEFGIPEGLAPVLGKLHDLCGQSHLTAYYIREVTEGKLVDGCDEHALVRAAVLTGMVEAMPFREGTAMEDREYRINLMAAAAWDVSR